MEDWGDFTLNLTVMPPERASERAATDLAADEELLPTQPFKKPTLDQLRPRPQSPVAAPPADSRPVEVPLPLRAGTLHSVAGLPLPPGPRPAPAPPPPPRATLDSLLRTPRPSTATTTPRPTTAARPTTARPSSRLTPAFGTRLTPASGSRLTPPGITRAGKSARGSRPAAARRSRWARDLLQRFNFDDCA